MSVEDVSVRRCASSFQRMAPVIPAKAGIQRARQRSAHGAEGCASSFQRMAPVIPAKAGIQRARQRSAHGAEGCVRRPAQAPSFQRRLESSVRDSGAHTGRRGVSAVPAQAPPFPAKAGNLASLPPCPGEGTTGEGRAEPYIVIGALIPISPSVRDSAVCAASASFSRAFISGASAGSAESTRQWS